LPRFTRFAGFARRCACVAAAFIHDQVTFAAADDQQGARERKLGAIGRQLH
jgi:hypothetical protein